MTIRTGAATAETEPDFVSQQVTDAQRYYLQLRPKRNAELVVVCGGMERLRSDYIVERRDFPYYCVEFVREGRGTLILNGRRYALGPGVAFAYAPGIEHTISNDPDSPMRKYYVDFTGSEAARLLSATPLGTWKTAQIVSPQEICDVFDDLDREARNNDAVARAICQTLLRLLLLKIRQLALPLGTNIPRSYATYERIRQHIEENYLKLNTIDQVAKQCRVTPMYVARLFRRYASMGAYRFLLHLKMKRAAELLQAGYLVKQAATSVGYTDPFHFSRSFKRVHGLSPEKLAGFRKSMR